MRWSIAAAAAALAAQLVVAPPARAGDAWTWPVRGRVVTAYANDNARPYAGGMHRGIDIAAASGAEVVAARTGVVTFAGPLGSAGVVVAVRNADGRHVTSYLHLRSAAVERGQHVPAGRRLGEVGTTGRRSTPAPHLHFGVRLATRERHYVDPLTLLPPVGAGRGAPAPPPATAPARVRPEPRPVPVAMRTVPSQAFAHARGTLLPGPTAAPTPAVSRPRGMAVPAGPLPQAVRGPLRHPATRPLPVDRPVPGADRGRPLVLAGLALVALVLFGGLLARLNGTVNELVAAAGGLVRGALRPRGRGIEQRA
jgi:hypothetical protein